MIAPTLNDLRASVDAAKKANILQKAALAEVALEDLLKYLNANECKMNSLERRLVALELGHLGRLQNLTRNEVTHGQG